MAFLALAHGGIVDAHYGSGLSFRDPERRLHQQDVVATTLGHVPVDVLTGDHGSIIGA